MTQLHDDPKPSDVTAIVLTQEGDGKYSVYPTDGWSTIGEPDAEMRGMVINVDDFTEVIIPFDQVRKFYNYMVVVGV